MSGKGARPSPFWISDEDEDDDCLPSQGAETLTASRIPDVQPFFEAGGKGKGKGFDLADELLKAFEKAQMDGDESSSPINPPMFSEVPVREEEETKKERVPGSRKRYKKPS